MIPTAEEFLQKYQDQNSWSTKGAMIEFAKFAAKETKSSKSSIIRCCKNKQKTANNFIWKYLNN